jgi:type I restriction enzyme S subunit
MMAQVKDLKTGIKYKDTPIGKIPVDWEVVRLEDVSEINMGQSPPSEDCSEEARGLPFYQGNAEFGSKYPSPQKWCEKPKKIANGGDTLISVRAPVGEINIAPHKCCIGRGLAAITAKGINPDYLYHSLFIHRKALQKIAQGSTFEAINSKELSDLSIFSPPFSEQKKIAEILTTVDEAIEKTDQIIDKTKEAKTGLMQRLLTRGIGHKNFKKTEIGEIPEEWEVVRLKDIAQKFYNGGTPDTKVKDYWDGNIPWVTGADFENQRVSHIRRYITIEGVKNSATNVIPKGNLLVVTRTGVGKIAIAPFDIAISQDITGVILDSEKALPKYVYWLLNYKSERLRSIIQGTSINGLLREDLEIFPISLPQIEEQKQIADILSSVDDEIDKESERKKGLETLKKGLMQVLLTGKIRVSV